MNDEELMSGTHDCGGDAAAYVLGALEPGEAEDFQRHLDGCIVCRDEVMAFQQVADALPMSAPQQLAPRGLRRRVRKEVREAARAETRAAPRKRLTVLRPAWSGGLAVVIALVAVGGFELASGGTSTRVFDASRGHAQLRVSGGHAELVVDQLAQPSPGHIYEVWLRRPNGSPQPTKALFSVTSKGAGDVDVPGDLRGISEVLVTQEPAGGSPHPTSQAVIVTHLT
jgi:anti-sigma factor RsiW